MPRPRRSSEPASVLLTLRLTPGEAEALRQRATRAGLTKADYLRAALRAYDAPFVPPMDQRMPWDTA